MKITSVKGTNDYLPREAAIRDYLLDTILKTYKQQGFEHIMTPILEDIQNLDKSEGGENLNLIFKILKRGQKFHKALEQERFNDLSDIGLRYDLTLPLSRYYANNKGKLALPLKCIQIDKVFRAERPQRGRMREFLQCDIDILGSKSINSEIELVTTTAKALLALGIEGFNIKINDRRVLLDLLRSLGFLQDQLGTVAISLDKLDKIGAEGVVTELEEKALEVGSITALKDLLGQLPLSLDKVAKLCPNNQATLGLNNIITAVETLADNRYTITFDISLVRGQGYYTGTVFEIESEDFRGSIAGGGRYDKLIGKFTKEEVPAVGFSIGFERIFSILLDKNFSIPDEKMKIALLYEPEDYVGASRQMEALMRDYQVVLLERPKKLGKYLNKLQSYGFEGFCLHGEGQEIKNL